MDVYIDIGVSLSLIAGFCWHIDFIIMIRICIDNKAWSENGIFTYTLTHTHIHKMLIFLSTFELNAKRIYHQVIYLSSLIMIRGVF